VNAEPEEDMLGSLWSNALGNGAAGECRTLIERYMDGGASAFAGVGWWYFPPRVPESSSRTWTFATRGGVTEPQMVLEIGPEGSNGRLRSDFRRTVAGCWHLFGGRSRSDLAGLRVKSKGG